MKQVIISHISSDRFYGKAYRQHIALFESLEARLLSSEALAISGELRLIFVDKPRSYVERVQADPQVTEVHMGRDLTFDYMTVSALDPGAQLKKELCLQVKRACDLLVTSEQSAEALYRIINHWYQL